jgi:hypothetical protein
MTQESSTGNSRQRPSDAPGLQDQAQPQPSQDAGFQFLNFSNFHATKTKETKSRVRSHVMHGIHQSKKLGKRSRPGGSIDLEISALFQPQPQASQQLSDDTRPDAAVAGPSRLGSGRTDPFQRYPIEMNQRRLELYDHCKYFLAFPSKFQKLSKP